MIEQLLPLTKKKIDILKHLYENQPTHLRKISAELDIHPYLVKKHIDTLTAKHIIAQQPAGKTILLTINTLLDGIEHILYVVEEYKQKSENKTLKNIIKSLQQQFGKNDQIISCVVFGSYARGAATKESDVDVLFIVKTNDIETALIKKASQLSTLMDLKFNPIIMTEDEFKTVLETKEPTTVTLLKPSQRIIVLGIEYFVRITVMQA
ncbi:MAG: nucleotidyltransferase domain-containing protein [Candidatus Aenigmarchaeota archaeon]|nr:nucleotidyltransferase domain-containing protein [Candidatus Aenigmarchaeota archaeon]